MERAVSGGARFLMPVADMFWGDRYGEIEDPFGHRWSLATPKRALSQQELRAAAEAFERDQARHTIEATEAIVEDKCASLNWRVQPAP